MNPRPHPWGRHDRAATPGIGNKEPAPTCSDQAQAERIEAELLASDRLERTPLRTWEVGGCGAELASMQLQPSEPAGGGCKQGTHDTQYNYGGGAHGHLPLKV